VRWLQFVIFDVAGALLWTATFLGIGYVFHRELAMAVVWLGEFAWSLAVLLLLLIPAAYIAFKYRQKKKFVRALASERITPEEVLKQMEAGEPLTIIDLRHPLDFLPDPRTLPSAVRITLQELENKRAEIPRDRDVILYCT
jgi:cbb3-type cytochrome oxidase subunit 3